MTPSRYKTLRHMETVRNYLNVVIMNLLRKGERHDQTKLESPEVEGFDVITEKLRGVTYGSDEYQSILKIYEPTINHHYQFNRHHPEFFPNGYLGMTLMDLIEMICDWKASSLRHNDGSIYKSLEINQERFGYSDELAQIFKNTVDWLQEQTVCHKAEES